MKAMKIRNSFFSMAELGRRFPFAFLTRKTLPLHEILEVAPTKARVYNFFDLLFFYSCDKIRGWGRGSDL